jgi:hypothetical protein
MTLDVECTCTERNLCADPTLLNLASSSPFVGLADANSLLDCCAIDRIKPKLRQMPDETTRLLPIWSLAGTKSLR